MIRHEICPLCSGGDISLLHSCTDHLVSNKSFDLFRCSKCGFVFTQDAPNESVAGAFYESEEYISHSDSRENLTDKIYQISRRIMMNRKRKIVKNATKLDTGRILDIGCGTGHFLNTMQEDGWSVSGIEINSGAREYCMSHFKIEPVSPDETGSLPDEGYDCITLWHVLEHIYDPFKQMNEIRRLLKPGGLCIIALPNSASSDSKYYGSDWAAWDVPRHIWHFNPLSFSVLPEKTGFKMVRTLSLPLDVFYISMLSEKHRGSKIAFIKGVIMGFIFSIGSLLTISKRSSLVYFIRK